MRTSTPGSAVTVFFTKDTSLGRHSLKRGKIMFPFANGARKEKYIFDAVLDDEDNAPVLE